MSTKVSNKQKPKQKSQRHRAEASPPTQLWWKSPMTWVVALIIVAGSIAVVTAAANRTRDTADTAAQTASVEILGTPLPAFASPDPTIGTEAPTVSAQTLQGDRVQLGGDGTARLFGFFAHWCPHCQAELPTTAQWLETNSLPSGVEVVAISTAVDEGGANYPPSDWFAREEWLATVLLDDPAGSLASGFGLTAFPFWVAVDADGMVVARVSGSMAEGDFAALVAAIAPDGSETSGAATPADEASQGIRLVSAADGAALLDNPPEDLVILDVRTQDEFADGHLDGALMIDFYADDFADQLAELDPDVPYLLYCRSGNRSGQTTAIMSQLGFSDVADIDGGILAWTQAGLPTATK